MSDPDLNEASPSLDRLIAERVMGHQTKLDRVLGERCCLVRRIPNGLWLLRRPSIDIGHAWEVVERMRALGWDWEIATMTAPANFWRARVTFCPPQLPRPVDPLDAIRCDALAPTAPLAICTAALAAIVATIGEGQR